MEECCAGKLPYKDAAGGVFDRVAGMDTDALKAGHIINQRQHPTEMRGFGQRQFVQPERDSSLGMGSVRDCGWFKRAAKRLATDKKNARCFGERGVDAD